ncbi:MAG: hypothetical protein IJ649_00720 [Oscillospiraceae bacterium]|nr:hypothetical protein [Oscillospiraceae bacterium]
MTPKEISEIFTIWALNWPSAELYQGGEKMLDLRCKIFAEHLSDVDYWDGLQGAAYSLKTRKFAPNIAEFREDIETAHRKIQSEINEGYTVLRSGYLIAKSMDEPLDEFTKYLPKRTQTVLRVMGGLEAFAPPDSPTFNYDGFKNTYMNLLRKRNALTGERFKELPAEAKALPGKKGNES